MNTKDVQAVVELEAADIKHLMKSGTTQVSDGMVTVKCEDAVEFQLVTPDGEPWGEE